MEEKILKLLGSTNYDDVMLGIELSYHLDYVSFKRLYKSLSKVGCKLEAIHRFGRLNTEVHITSFGSICFYPNVRNRSPNVIYPWWINLGHKNY